jgi:VanZ family protein
VPIGLIAAGGAIEILQSLIGRDAQLGDWIAEIIAVGLAWGIVASLRARSREREQPAPARS